MIKTKMIKKMKIQLKQMIQTTIIIIKKMQNNQVRKERRFKMMLFPAII